MKLTALPLIAGLAFAGVALAQTHAHHEAVPATTARSTVAPTEGVVKQIDLRASRITLQHGEIPNLEMPPMTMTFSVKDSASLESLKTGDRVRFRADRIAGEFAITSIEMRK